MATTTLDANTVGTQTQAGKYLTFTLGPEAYGIPVLKVREIIRLVDITPVPQAPVHVRGVINLRGKIVPVADLRIRFGMPVAEPTEKTCIVVVHVKSASASMVHMGLIVDGVEEVVNLAQADLEETPDFGSKLSTEYLQAMAKIKGKVVSLLNIDLVLLAASTEQLFQPNVTE